jgi:microcystin-dependent protein
MAETTTSNVPLGGIIIWSGSFETIPDGWGVCDGANGTPDLRDRFVQSNGNIYNVGDIGGANEVTLNINQIPPHSHDVPKGNTGGGIGVQNGPLTGGTLTTQSTGGGQPHENRPPYYALYYIMKLFDSEIDIVIIPSNGIILWPNTIGSIPSGWVFCDGNNGTPDLRDRFVVGAGNNYFVGNTGGVSEVTLNINQIPPHSHDVPKGTVDGGEGVQNGPLTAGVVTSQSTGGGQPHENRPPYYCLVHMMRVNVTPTADAGTNQSVDENTTVTLDGSGSTDPNTSEGDVLSYSWTQTGGTSVTLSDPTSVSPTFTAPNLSEGSVSETLTFSLTVTDLENESSTDTTQVVVNEVTDVGPTALYNISITDPDSNTTTFNNQDNSTFNDSDGVFAETSTNSGSTIILNGSPSSDADGDLISYEWTQISGTSTLISGTLTTEEITFDIPTGSEGENIDIQLTVSSTNEQSQETKSDTSTATFIVGDYTTFNGSSSPTGENQAPIANAGVDQSITYTPNTSFTIDLNGTSSTDSDLGTLSYQWDEITGILTSNGISISDANTSTPFVFFDGGLPAEESPINLEFRLIVTDNGGLTDSDRSLVSLTADNTQNQPPIANAGVDETVTEGSTVTLDGSGSSDSDISTLSYQWTQINGISVTLNNSNTSVASFTAPQVTQNETLTFRLTVTDSGGLSSTDDVVITVQEQAEVLVTNQIELTSKYNSTGNPRIVNSDTVGILSRDTSILRDFSSVSNGSIESRLWEITSDGGTGASFLNGDDTSEIVYISIPDVTGSGTPIDIKLTLTDDQGGQHVGTTTLVATDFQAYATVNTQGTPDPNENEPVNLLATTTIFSAAGSLYSLSANLPNIEVTNVDWTQTQGTTVTLTKITPSNQDTVDPFYDPQEPIYPSGYDETQTLSSAYPPTSGEGGAVTLTTPNIPGTETQQEIIDFNVSMTTPYGELTATTSDITVINPDYIPPE